MTTTARMYCVAFDAADIDRLASFYAELTGWRIVDRDPDWTTIQNGEGQRLSFQLAPDHLPPQWPGQERPQQVHLDLVVDGIEAAAERAIGLGATRLGPTQPHEFHSWITLADPAGHPFDLCQKDGVGPVMGLFAVTIDAPAAPELARFYAELLGLEVTYDGPEGSMVSGGGDSLMFQPVSDYNPPTWPDPARPQQAHLDLAVDDLDEGEVLALKLGARLLDSKPETFRVFSDPAGHPFCLIKD